MQEKHLQNSTSFHDKNLDRLGIEQTYFNIVEATHDKLTVNIILNGEN